MEFRIADTFTDSLARLTGEEQKAVKTTAFDLQINHAQPGLSFHKLDKSKDKNFWSVRVTGDIRVIVHRSDSSLLLCYVDHHDKAYEWAERRKLVAHPKTGAAQLVEVVQTMQEVVVPVYVQKAQPIKRDKPPDTTPFLAAVSDDELLGYGVPVEWLEEVRKATRDSILDVATHLPAEAGEALLELAVGGKPRAPVIAAAESSPFEHPDAMRRFRVMTSVEELQAALDYPWEKWTVFLHPEQRQWVEKTYAGPARVSGSAGTGKTIVALHRAAHMARKNPDARLLLTTFSDTLAHALQTKLKRLLAGEPRLGERIDVASLGALGRRLYKAQGGKADVASRVEIRELLSAVSAATPGHKFSLPFLLSEWDQIVDAWQLGSWEDYRDVTRLGRKTRLPEAQRRLLWTMFDQVRETLQARNRVTESGVFAELTTAALQRANPVYDFVVVDEAQDISVAHLRYFAALGRSRPDALFFAGDIGQRIFQQPFSWKSLGVDIRGRSRTLRVNYRTSHQIRQQAERLLGPTVTDIDGNAEERRDTVSVFNGPAPEIRSFKTTLDESRAVGDWIAERAQAGLLPNEFGVFVRSKAEIARAVAAVTASGLMANVLDEQVETASGTVSICTMHLAKGLEFRAVAVMACDDEVIPAQSRVESVGDDADLAEVYETERQLLYVACTRARDQLLVTALDPRSEFLDDLALA